VCAVRWRPVRWRKVASSPPLASTARLHSEHRRSPSPASSDVGPHLRLRRHLQPPSPHARLGPPLSSSSRMDLTSDAAYGRGGQWQIRGYFLEVHGHFGKVWATPADGAGGATFSGSVRPVSLQRARIAAASLEESFS
jgi:hypothetical protein